MPSELPLKIDLLGKSASELGELAVSLGEPAYRGSQIYHALYAERRFDVSQMSNLPGSLRERLAALAAIRLPRIERQYASADGSVRYLLSVESAAGETGASGSCIHARGAPADHLHFHASRLRGGLPFLPDGAIGLAAQSFRRRNPGASARAARRTARAFDSADQRGADGAGRAAVELRKCDGGGAHTARPGGHGAYRRGMSRFPPPASFRESNGWAPSQCGRNWRFRSTRRTMRSATRSCPSIGNTHWRNCWKPAANYPLRSWERLTFEYVLLGGVNDSAEDARRVAKLLAPIRAKVNLIPWNPGELPYQRPTAEATEAFRRVIDAQGIPVFVRYSRGQDVMAACGQLALLEASPRS